MTLSDLSAEMWGEAHFDADRLGKYLIRFVESRRGEILDLVVLTDAWPTGLDPRAINWRVRTRNCLAHEGLLVRPELLGGLTFGDLWRIRAMGTKSVLDFAAAAESAIAQFSRPTDSRDIDEVRELCELLANEPWIHLITDEDPRFRRDLVLGATLADQVDFVLRQADPERPTPWIEGDTDRVAIDELRRSFDSILATVARIDGLPLEAALRDYLSSLSRLDGRRLDGIVARLGVGGAPPVTLEEAGRLIGVTRERVRQLQRKIDEGRPVSPVYMPKLDDAVDIVAASAPALAEGIAAELEAQGVTSGPFHPASVVAAAEFCGRPVPFTIARTGREEIVTTGTGAGYVALGSVATRQASAYGASNVHEVVAGLAEKGIALTDAEVRAVLSTSTQRPSFLDEDWFWFPAGRPGRNRLRNTTRAILSVASPLEVRIVREGLRRRYRWRGLTLVPPRGVLLAFYDQHPEFEVVGEGAVQATSVLDYRQELGETERTLVEVLRSTPAGVLDRVSFQRACVARGMNINMFSVYTTYSPILDHLGTDLWALRGLPVDAAAVEALRRLNAERPREQRVLDWGWTAEGSLWIATRVPEDGRGGAVFGIPGAVRRYVQGRTYQATAEDGTPAGQITVAENGSSWGYGPFLRRMGADFGDVLRIDFFLDSETVLLKLGDADLLPPS